MHFKVLKIVQDAAALVCSMSNVHSQDILINHLALQTMQYSCAFIFFWELRLTLNETQTIYTAATVWVKQAFICLLSTKRRDEMRDY